MKLNILESNSRDHVPVLSYVVTVYLITIGILALIR